MSISAVGSPFSHSLRAICTVLLDHRDPLLQSERTPGFAADPVYGRAKCLPMLGELRPKGPKDHRKKRPKGPNEGITSHAPLEDHPLDTHREPSALYCWILEILYCNPKGRRALLRIPSTEGRSVCLCWAKSKPKGPKGREGRVVGLCWASLNLKDLTENTTHSPAPSCHRSNILRIKCCTYLWTQGSCPRGCSVASDLMPP